jgi:hypothetical protein
MEPFLVIYILDKRGNPLQDIFHGTVLPQLDLLRLKGFDKALSMGILIGVTLSAHADLKTIQSKLSYILTREANWMPRSER